MKSISRFFIITLIFSLFSNLNSEGKTKLSIKGNQFYINGKLTYKGRYWQGNKIEGLLMNSRMVQGIYDDANPETRKLIVYPDTKTWDPDRNTNEFIAAMPKWRAHGLLAFTLNMQGGSPIGYGNKNWINSAYDKEGNLKTPYMERLEKIIDRADKLGMVVILGYFYFGQDQNLENEEAVINATDNLTAWILKKGHRNVIVEVNNECDAREYDHPILRPDRVHELIARIKNTKNGGNRLLISTSYTGGVIPKSNVVSASDLILLHGNAVKEAVQIAEMVEKTKKVEGYRGQPIVFNEDDHFDFESKTNYFITAVKAYASWGYFDYRLKGESAFEEGYQSMPVDWGINSERKKGFFKLLKEITGS